MWNKYGNRKTQVNGITFDSKAESIRFEQLQMFERAGLIRGLRRQVPFVLIEGQQWSDGKKHRDTVYKADFVYWDCEAEEIVVEDVKGYMTDVYKLKRELMKDRFGIEIREVRA